MEPTNNNSQSKQKKAEVSQAMQALDYAKKNPEKSFLACENCPSAWWRTTTTGLVLFCRVEMRRIDFSETEDFIFCAFKEQETE